MATDLRADLLAWIDARLEECERASKEPWRSCDPGSNFQKGKRFIRHANSEGLIAIVSGERTTEEKFANARFISSSRTLLPLVLRAVRAEVEAHKWSQPNVPATCSERWYRCVGCASSYPVGEACLTVRRLSAALIGGEK